MLRHKGDKFRIAGSGGGGQAMKGGTTPFQCNRCGKEIKVPANKRHVPETCRKCMR